MKIIVQKFGGTSVSTRENRTRCIQHIKNAINDGYQVVVVISAMGRKGEPYATDTLLSLLNENFLPKREQDLLLSTGELISSSVLSQMLFEEGINNTVLTGGQAGIITNDDFSNAKIISLKPDRIVNELKQGRVVVVPGFQGVTLSGEVTTLGRGGSDTSASALGVALDAEYVDIFTDVEGIMTADPRIVHNPRMLSTVSYNEICNLAHLGAKVIHPRAVEFAMQKNIPLRIRSTFSDSEGTMITYQTEGRKEDTVLDNLIAGITQQANLTQIKVATENSMQTQLSIFESMKNSGISVDFITIHPEGVMFTIQDSYADQAQTLIEKLGVTPVLTKNCSKVSIVGANISGVPGVMARIVKTLANASIEILQSVDSHTTIWVLVRGEFMQKAVQSLHQDFFGDNV